MRSLNMVQLIGQLGSDPEIFEANGNMTSKFSVATNEHWKDKKTQEKKEKTEWHRIVSFNKLAEITRDYLKQGSKVYIAGKLSTSKWVDPDDHVRFTTEIIANELIILSTKAGPEESKE